MTFLITHWKAILIAVALFGSNYITKEYVSRGYEQKLSEMNVEGLKSTLAQQQDELVKQHKLLQEKTQNEQYYVKENAKLDAAFDNLSNEYQLLVNELDSVSRTEEDGSTGVDRVSASNSTTKLVLSELQRHTLKRAVELSQAIDKLHLSNELCVREYESVRSVINETKANQTQ